MKFSILLKIFVVITILGLSYFLRYTNFVQVPVAGTSMDEYSYSWVGLSLIKDHYPVGISGINGYKNNEQKYVNPDNLLHISVSGPFVFNYPWFDHPPLLGLITGGYAYLKGVRNFEDVHLHIIRQPMIIFGTLAVLLTFIFGYINLGYFPSIIAMIIYGTAPLSVVGSRMVQGENGMIIPYLLSLISISLFLKNKNNLWLFLAGCFCGITLLFKLSGVAAPLTVIGLIYFSKLKNKHEKTINIVTIGIISLLFLSLFFVYGYYYDWEIFKNIILSNANRLYGIGPNSIFNLITQAKLTQGKNIADGWVLVGWICLFLNINNRYDKRKFLIMPIIFYTIVYIFFGSFNYGWYMFPLLPFLAINTGYRLNIIIKNRKIVTGVLLGFIAIGSGVVSVMNVDKFQNYSGLWRIGLPIIIASALFFDQKKIAKNYLGKLLLIALFLTSIVLNIIFIKTLDATSWYANIW